MIIDDTRFGSITIDGQLYSHDVYILPSGKTEKRNKKKSPRIHGHRSLGVEEIKYLLSYEPEILFIGKGQTGVLPIQPEAEVLLESLDIEIHMETTPNLIDKFNQIFSERKNVAAVFHTTC
ncbi:MAG: hypothetical protein JW776_00960 [Candidatus Lokiarchaeota archaeon]|nr:hypothetical protein [Candidatus Lokiarchaeota archaeon]